MVRSCGQAIRRAGIPAPLWREFARGAEGFERIQKRVLPKEMVDIDGFVTFFKAA